jgi:hypothetical protein
MPRNFSSWQCAKVCELVLVASACAGPAGAAFTYVGSIGWHGQPRLESHLVEPGASCER